MYLKLAFSCCKMRVDKRSLYLGNFSLPATAALLRAPYIEHRTQFTGKQSRNNKNQHGTITCCLLFLRYCMMTEHSTCIYHKEEVVWQVCHRRNYVMKNYITCSSESNQFHCPFKFLSLRPIQPGIVLRVTNDWSVKKYLKNSELALSMKNI